MRILIAARANGIAAIDGPYVKVRDVDGFRRVAGRSAALGYDGKWVLHPDQIAAGNEIFSPRQEAYDRAELILEAYEWHTSRAGGARGAAMLGDEMIDEASRKMALVVASKAAPPECSALASGSHRPSRPRRPDRGGQPPAASIDRLTTTDNTSVTAPTAIPATAMPCPACRVCLIWLSATIPSTMPMIEPMPQHTPTIDATSDPIASGFVPSGGGGP